MKKADENQSNTNYHDQKSTEDQVLHSTENLNENPNEIYVSDDTFSNIDVDNNEHAVVIICEEIEERDHESKAKNQTVSKKAWSESNTASSNDNEENKTNAAAIEMTFSVSQSNVLYGYYLCETTFTLLLLYLGYDGKFSSVIFLRHIS